MATIVDELLAYLLHNFTLSTLAASFFTAAFYPHHSHAAEWKVSPMIDIQETYSDNVRLAPPGSEISDYITQINPGISFTGLGPRIKLDAKYVLQNYFYAREKTQHKTNQLLNAGAKIELLDEYFFVDANSTITQQTVSPLGPITPDSTNINLDRSEIRTNRLSPYLQHRYSDLLSTELRYTHSTVETSANGFLNNKEDDLFFDLKNDNTTSQVNWGLSYQHKNIDYTNSNSDFINEKSTLNLAYRLTSKLSLTGSGGYEKYNYQSNTQKPEGPFWLLGFSWTPSDRTNLSANGGKRFLGENYTLMGNHHTRRTVWSLGYNEDITDTQSQFLIPATIDTSVFLNQLLASSIPDPIIRQQVVNAFILDNGLSSSLANPVNFLSNRIFLQKRLQASVAITGAKNTILFTYFNNLRESLTSQTADSALFGVNSSAISDRNKQIGNSVLWNYKVTPRTSLVTNLSYVKNIFVNLHTEYITQTFSLNLNKTFQPKLTGSVGLRRTIRESAQGIGDYRENAATASVQYNF